ncbi:hypothetical protein CQY20_29905 [Mycolicibacterium agri]|nr:hypothetical protein CQY20_29905 [Mycolicibacterium agri]
MTAAGLLAVTPPQAQAAPCNQFAFDGPFELAGSKGWWVKFNTTGTTPRTSATVHFVDGGKVDGTIIGGSVQGRKVDLSIVWGDKPNNIWDFHGTVGDDGHVNDGGEQLRNIPPDYAGEVAASWRTVTPLKCIDAPAQANTDTGPAAPPPPPPPPPQPVKCPVGSPVPEVPAGQTCPAPKDAIRVTFTRAPLQWTVSVTNSADIGGNCTYNATANNGTPGASNNFTIAPKGTANFNVPAPAPFTTYRVVTSCTGTYDGKQIEFGRDEQNVSL